MEAPDFVNSSETRLAVSRIITWTTEPKSSDVRKVRSQFNTHKDLQAFYPAVKWISFVPSDNRGNIEVEICVRRIFHVFQAAQSVLISLFQLNTPEFSMLLAALPKTFQDGATKLLQNHLKNTGSVAQVRYARTRRTVCVSGMCVTLRYEFPNSVHRHPWAVL